MENALLLQLVHVMYIPVAIAGAVICLMGLVSLLTAMRDHDHEGMSGSLPKIAVGMVVILLGLAIKCLAGTF